MLGLLNKSVRGGAEANTVIGQTARIEGDLHFSGNLHVDGTIKGDIVADAGSPSVLTVSETGSIEGSVQAGTVVLNGSVSGDIHAEDRIELASSSRVSGDVHYRLIEMAMGARVNGSLIHQEESHAAVLTFGRDTAAGPDQHA